MVFDFFVDEVEGPKKEPKFDPDNPDEYFHKKYSGGPTAIERLFSKDEFQEMKKGGKSQFLKLGAVNTAAKVI